MQHIAILDKKRHLLERILSGEKRIESRWYISRKAPWDRISQGDIVYFKNSGEHVGVVANVSKVLQFEALDPAKVDLLLHKYGKLLGMKEGEYASSYDSYKNKRFCILVFISEVRQITPFEIDKKGFGNMAAWLTVKRIDEIARRGSRIPLLRSAGGRIADLPSWHKLKST